MSKEAIEFANFKLNRKKVLGRRETVVVPMSALKPGSYAFYDDFHAGVPAGGDYSQVKVCRASRRIKINKEM